MSLLQNSNAISSGGYNLESSLRLRESASAYLSRTPTSTGDRQKFTVSAWIKFSKLDSSQILNSIASSGNRVLFRFSGTNGTFHVIISEGGINYTALSNAYLRDPSAWYHLVVAVDTTQATSINRIKGYINGEEITSWSTHNPPAQNYNMHINYSSATMAIGADTDAPTYQSDAYYSEYNYVDGQALTADDFGETDTITGVWKPKEYTGTYGTNGFYLPFKETQQATGFNTVLYTGNGGTQSISNVGFSPDLVWVKARSSALSNYLYDSVRGGSKRLRSDTTDAEITASGVSSFDSNGFTLGSAGGENGSGVTYVGWCWDAGSSTVSNTDGSITSTVRANPATGFSIVTYTGNTTAGATVGHGLGSAPDMIIIKDRDTADNWAVYHSSLGGGNASLFLEATTAVNTSLNMWNSTAPSSSVITLGDRDEVNRATAHVAYCFSEVAGYSKFGSYTGNGVAGTNTVTTGFRPAFVMIKRTDTTSNWTMLDVTRDPDSDVDKKLYANTSGAENTSANSNGFIPESNGFTLDSTFADTNASGGTYIYMAFADTRDAQFNFDASGNKNNWTANNINSNASSETTYDIMNDVATLTDEDTGNFATIQPLDRTSTIASSSITNANLTASITGGAGNGEIIRTSTINLTPDIGKIYWEVKITSLSGGSFPSSLIFLLSPEPCHASNGTTVSYTAYTKADGSSNLTNPPTFGTGDYLMFAYDASTGKYWVGKNGTWTNSGDPAAGTNEGITISTANTYAIMANMNTSGATVGVFSMNFGQRPFKYTPPTGFKKLNTYNLPDSTIKDGSQYFIPNTFTGTGSTLSIDTGFSPDFVWLKSRSFADHPLIYDSIRGANKRLYSSLTNAESTATDQLNSFNSDGYTLGSDPSGQINVSGQTSVGWSWRGSDSSAVTNTDGTITSTVSANPTSGFAIATYTGTGNVDTVGHGLTVQPDFIMVKDRSAAQSWICYTKVIDGSNDALFLDTTAAKGDSGFSGATSTVFDFSVGASSYSNTAGRNYVMYSFASIEGFSKISSYTGNGSADGTFVYTGFKPAFVLFKRTDSTSNWIIFDQERGLYNLNDNYLYANAAGAEGTSASSGVDLLSNGFKQRNTYADANTSGGTYLYMAFAENPFKNSLAR